MGIIEPPKLGILGALMVGILGAKLDRFGTLGNVGVGILGRVGRLGREGVGIVGRVGLLRLMEGGLMAGPAPTRLRGL